MRAQFLVVAVLVCGFVACGDDGPSSPVIPSFLGPPKSLQISGNLTFTTVGQGQQLTATATFSGGATRNVTNQSKWEVTNPGVATVNATGFLRVTGAGDTQVTATFRGVTSAVAAVSVKLVPTVTGLVVTGPSLMTPASIEQFTATQQLSDGSTRDVSATASWFSNSALLRHLGGGRFESRGAGEARVTASISPRSNSLTVLMLPSGTFKVSGTVRDASGGVERAIVEVVSGTGAGLSTSTSFNGTYALYGLAGTIRLRVTVPGYQTQEDLTTITDQAVRDFTLTTTSPIVDVSGNWTLVVSASPACSSSWPEMVRRREATVAITQQGTRLTAKFSGEAVVPNTLQSTGRIAGNVFTLSIYGDNYYYLEYALLARPTLTDWVGIYGTLDGTATSSAVTGGRFTGWFDYYVTAQNAMFVNGRASTCQADTAFELRR